MCKQHIQHTLYKFRNKDNQHFPCHRLPKKYNKQKLKHNLNKFPQHVFKHYILSLFLSLSLSFYHINYTSFHKCFKNNTNDSSVTLQ